MATANPSNPCFLPVLMSEPIAEPSIYSLFFLFAAAQTANMLSIQYRNVGQMTQKRYFYTFLHLFSLAYCVCQIKMRLLHYQTTATERGAKNKSPPISQRVYFFTYLIFSYAYYSNHKSTSQERLQQRQKHRFKPFKNAAGYQQPVFGIDGNLQSTGRKVKPRRNLIRDAL